MTHKNFFRLIAAFSLVAAITSGVVAAFPGDISNDWKAVLEWQGNGDVFMNLYEISTESGLNRILFISICGAAVVFAVATQIGIFLFWRFARPSYAVLTILLVVYSFFGGLLIMTPIEAALYNLALLLDGAIIAMSYLSPINGYFNKRSVNTG